ncbi:hypothetical protein ACERII_01735 [Evansella sp. AB-rgal1]|uniref:hypothetical protein n=1 Tax=Evansella sp. AB-rgal1 TaxID=3242696 RepID=UPI00359DCF8F
MEINDNVLNIKTSNKEQPLQLRAGGVYDAKIESRVSEREAVVSIRGQKVNATFSGTVPNGDKVSVQIEGRTEDGVRLREVSSNKGYEKSSESGRTVEQSLERLIRHSTDRAPSPELRQAVERLHKNNIPLSKESVRDLHHFIEKGIGTREQRLNTVDMITQKRLEPTSSNLHSVHEALHGRKISEQMKEINPKTNIRNETMDTSRFMSGRNTTIEQHISETRDIQRNIDRETSERREPEVRVDRQAPERREPEVINRSDIRSVEDIGKTNRSEVSKALEQLNKSERSQWPAEIRAVQQVLERSDTGVRAMVNQGLREALQLQSMQKAMEANERISMLMNQVQRNEAQHVTPQSTVNRQMLENFNSLIQNEPNMQQAINQIQNTIAGNNDNQEVNLLLRQGITDAINKLDQGRELKARQIIIDTIQRAENLLPMMHTPPQDSRVEMEQYVANEIMQSIKSPSKQLLMTEVTERLAAATDEFKSFKREVTNQLSRIEHIIQQFRSQSTQQAKPMLENVIRQLDNALLKNNWLLFADMKTEKQVLQASSQLAEAKKLLAKGNHTEARQIVREVQNSLDRLNFKPNNQKIIHHIVKEQEWQQSKPGVHRLSTQYEQTVRTLTYNQGSAREVFEGLRGLGLNREAEIGQLLASGKDVGEDQQRNMKSLFFQAAHRDEEGSKIQQQAQQSLQNIAGQQLMSRSDHQQNMQMLMFQIPLLLKDAVENLQVFVNSRNEGEKIDWENCSLYFLIDTKKMGEVGISLNVTERSLSVTIKNDSASFQSKVEPLANKYLEKLKDIGFNVKELHFAAMSMKENVDELNKIEEQQRPTMTKKGFDYKI